MKGNTFFFLFLFFIICSSLTFAVSQNDLDIINRINARHDVLIDDNTVLSSNIEVEGKIIYTPATSQLEEIALNDEKVTGTVYSDDATIQVNDSNINLSNIGVEKGLIAVAGDNIKGDFLIKFYTNMPNTPFSVKHYDGITDNKTLVQLEGTTIIPLIYSDSFGTITYNSNDFSTQILSFPDPLVHSAGGQTTTYYLDYFFSSYDFVSFKETGVFLINDSWSNYSAYESTSPTEDYVEYSDSDIETYFQGATKRVRLISKNVTAGFYKTVQMCAYNNIGLGGSACQSFNWDLNSTTVTDSKYPVQLGFIPNQSITKNNRKIIYFNDYYSNYTDIVMTVYNASNLSQTGRGFNQIITVNTTQYEYDNISNSTIFLVDLNGLGYGISTAIYTNNTENVTLQIEYTAMKKNSSGDYNSLNTSTFFLYINGSYPSNQPSTLINNLTHYYSFDNNTILIDSVGSMNGTITGTTNTSGIVGNARNFTGSYSTDYVAFGTNTWNLTSLGSINLWIKRTDYTNPAMVIGKWQGGGNEIAVAFQGQNTLTAWFPSSSYSTNYANLTQCNTGQWCMITLSYNGSLSKMYVNGVAVANVSATGNIANTGVNTLYLGRESTGGWSTALHSVLDELTVWNRSLTETEILRLYSNGTGCGFSCINATIYTIPIQTYTLPNISIEEDDLVYIDYNDYFTGFDRIYINFTVQNGTNISLYSLLNATSEKFNDSYFTLNISGNGYTERLYVTAGLNTSYTKLNVSICNYNACLNVAQYLNISEHVITTAPIQTYHIDNIVMQKNEIHLENWGAYFDDYVGISISFIDLITNDNITILYINETANYTSEYLNITTFLNGIHLNTTFQSFNESYYAVLLIEAINPYGTTGQYVNLNINYTYVPPPTPINQTCETAGVICLLPDYTELTQSQMNMYIIFGLLITIGLLIFVYVKLGIDLVWLLIIIGIALVIFELIYFVKIKYIPITYIVWITLALMGVLYIIYKRLSA